MLGGVLRSLGAGYQVKVTYVQRCAAEAKAKLNLEWPLSLALALQQRCAGVAEKEVFRGAVCGQSSPSIQGVGRGAVQVKLADADAERLHRIGVKRDMGAGGFVVGIRRAQASYMPLRNSNHVWLPGIAGVSGHHPDRSGTSRYGLAEIAIMARPLSSPDPPVGSKTRHLPTGPAVTCLSHTTVCDWLPHGTPIDVVILGKGAPFIPHSPRWLKVRMRMVADGALGVMREGERENTKTHGDTYNYWRAEAGQRTASFAQLLDGSGLVMDPTVEAPVPYSMMEKQHHRFGTR